MIVAVLITGLLSVSCIKDSYGDCPRPFRLFIKAIDADMNDITSSGEVQQVILFVFNEKQEIVKAIELDSNHIKSIKPVDVKLDYPGHQALQFVAWGNIGPNVEFPTINSVKKINDLYVSLKNAEAKTMTSGKISHSPDDLFYGNLSVPVEYRGVEPSGDQTIVLSRKTAQVSTAAFGLKLWNRNLEGEYAFELGVSLDTYNEAGILTDNITGYSPTANMDNLGNLSTPIFHTFPTSDGKTYTLYIRFNGEVIFADTKDSNGHLFVPEVGRLLNIIIHFEAPREDQKVPSNVSIKTVVTPWNQVFQHVEL